MENIISNSKTELGDKAAVTGAQLIREAIQVNGVANIIVATGFKTFDAGRISEFGYGRFPNVLTSLEFERLVNAAGPTGGDIRFRTRDKKGLKHVDLKNIDFQLFLVLL